MGEMAGDTVGSILKIIGILAVTAVVLAVVGLFAYQYYNSRLIETTTLETTAQEEGALQELLQSKLIANNDDLKNFLSADMLTMINSMMKTDLVEIGSNIMRVLNIVLSESGGSAGKTINVHPHNITCVKGEVMCIITL